MTNVDQDTRAPASRSLLGPPNEGYRQIAEFARIPNDDRRWDGMLKVARRLSGEYDRSAALLWLYDEEKECFHLDSYDPREPGRELARLSLTCTSPIAKNAAQVRARTESSKEVTSWLAERSLGPRRELFPVTPTHGPAGYLEVVTDSPLAPDSTELLTDFAHVIAARIARHRDRRHLEVYEQLTELLAVQAEQPEDGADVWLKVVAKVARKATAAAVALVFRQAPDLTLRGVAADPPEIDASL